MPRGDKSAYTDKQVRQAEHIEEGYEHRGVSEGEAERRAWATVNKETGGGKRSGSGRGKLENTAPSRKGGRLGGQAAASRPAASRSASAKKAAETRKREASKASVACQLGSGLPRIVEAIPRGSIPGRRGDRRLGRPPSGWMGEHFPLRRPPSAPRTQPCSRRRIRRSCYAVEPRRFRHDSGEQQVGRQNHAEELLHPALPCGTPIVTTAQLGMVALRRSTAHPSALMSFPEIGDCPPGAALSRRRRWRMSTLFNVAAWACHSRAKKMIATCAAADSSSRTSRCGERRRWCFCAVLTPMPISARSQSRPPHEGGCSRRRPAADQADPGRDAGGRRPLAALAAARDRQGALCRRGRSRPASRRRARKPRTSPLPSPSTTSRSKRWWTRAPSAPAAQPWCTNTSATTCSRSGRSPVATSKPPRAPPRSPSAGNTARTGSPVRRWSAAVSWPIATTGSTRS